MSTLPGLGPDLPTVTSPSGAMQSAIPYRCDLLPARAVLAVSDALAKGVEKYPVDNWRGLPLRDHLNHALTHCFAFLAGDQTEEHLAHAACRILFALESERIGGRSLDALAVEKEPEEEPWLTPEIDPQTLKAIAENISRTKKREMVLMDPEKAAELSRDPGDYRCGCSRGYPCGACVYEFVKGARESCHLCSAEIVAREGELAPEPQSAPEGESLDEKLGRIVGVAVSDSVPAPDGDGEATAFWDREQRRIDRAAAAEAKKEAAASMGRAKE